MGKENDSGPTPNVIRGACRARFYDSLDTLSAIARNTEAKHSDRIRAIDALGRFGLGAADQGAVHIHAGDGGLLLGVVRLPALDPVPVQAVEERANEVEIEPKRLGSGE